MFDVPYELGRIKYALFFPRLFVCKKYTFNKSDKSKMHVFCVHTDDRPDREENVLKQAEKYGLEIEIVEFEKDGESPLRGCCNSHLSIVEMAKERELDRIMVVENDVYFKPMQFVDGPTHLPASMLYLGGTLSRIEYEEPTRRQGSDTIGVLVVKPTHTFLELDKMIISRRQDVLILTMDGNPESTFDTFAATDSTNAFVVDSDIATTTDVMVTKTNVIAVSFAKELYHRANLTDCFRAGGQQLIGVANITAIMSRLQEVIFMPVVHTCLPIDVGGIFECEWKLLKDMADERRLWLPSTCLSTHCYVLTRDAFGRVIDLLTENLKRPLNKIQPVDVIYQTSLHPTINCYTLLSPIAFQIPSYSNIESRTVDYQKLHTYSRPAEYPIA
jgi:hypothetical protein